MTKEKRQQTKAKSKTNKMFGVKKRLDKFAKREAQKENIKIALGVLVFFGIVLFTGL